MFLRFLRCACFAGLFALLISFSRDTAAQTKRVSVDELARASTSVVHGRITSVRSFWTDDKHYIMTEVTIRVDDALRGSAPSETILTIPGGRVGSTLYEISDMPVFVEGEEVVVFVWEHPSGKKLVTGGIQGKLTVVEDQVSRRKMVLGVRELFNPEVAGKVGDQPVPKEMALDEFTRRIKEIGQR